MKQRYNGRSFPGEFRAGWFWTGSGGRVNCKPRQVACVGQLRGPL